jgi:endonuclease/exonuclease/phosphatase family metal-dependent hydrolase
MYRLLTLLFLASAPLAHAQTPTPIADVRAQGNGQTVTVAGRITVSDQFGGPAYFQDGTGGLSIFLPDLHNSVSLGDSVVITGETEEFGATSGEPGSGGFQIDSNGTTWRVVESGDVPQPRLTTIDELTPNDASSEALEGMLVRIRNVAFDDDPGTFSQNTNYTIVDASGNEVQLRIDNTTNLVGAQTPSGRFDVVGVVGEFRGTRQVLPRFTDDLGVAEFEYPAEDISRDLTFEAVTWNIENFGSDSRAPDDDQTQLENVLQVMRTIDAELYGVQEIADAQLFQALLDSLDGHGGMLAPFSTSTAVQQRTGFVFKKSVIDSLSSGLLFTSGSNPFGPTWANGRWPFGFTFDATIDGETRRMSAVVLHAKAIQTVEDRNRREADSELLKTFLDDNWADRNVIVLGDFNDDVDESNVGGRPSPYANFTSDPDDWQFVTSSLSARGVATISGGTTIDHILISDELFDEHIDGTERTENVSYVGSYLSTTSDHFPVWTRFDFGTATSTPVARTTDDLVVSVVAPNPTRGAFALDLSRPASVTVYDALGRLLSTTQASAGRLALDLSAQPAGLYLIRVADGSAVVTRSVVRLAR